MPLPSMNAAIGWKPQSAKDSSPSAPYYWHKMLNSNFSIVEQVRPIPPELGGTLLPDGMYKGGYWSRGRIDFIPRLQDHFGWLLWSLSGSAYASGSGPYHHVFPGQPDTLVPDKWLSFRRVIPVSGNAFFGETFANCKIGSFSLRAVPGQMLQCSVDVLGMAATGQDNASGSGWDPTTDGGYEAYTGIPIATVSGFELPEGQAMTNVQSANLTIDNGITDPASMMVLGSYTPVDYVALTRNITVEATVFWENATLYKNVYMNGGTSWSPIVYQNYSPFEMWFKTPNNLPGTAYQGELGFYANVGAITWTVTPVELRGGDIIVLNFVGTVNAISSGQAWQLYLNNSRSTVYAP